MRIVLTLGCIFCILSSLACEASDSQLSQTDLVWPVTDTLVSASAGVIGHTTALAVSPDDLVFVLDGLNSQVHKFTADGVFKGSIGGEGSGPGEMRRPASFWVDQDTIWIVDQRNGRIQGLNLVGEMTASAPLPPEAGSSRNWIGPGGQLLVSGWGRDSTLVSHFDREGRLINRIGVPPETAPEFLDMVAIHQEIVSGEIPEFFRNQVIPVPSIEGGIWAARMGDGVVQRYGRLGDLVFESQLTSAEFQGILDAFFSKNRADMDFPGFFPLRYFADAQEVGGELWLLLNREDGEMAVILSVSRSGELIRKILMPGVIGANTFAADPDGGRVFLGVPSAATVLRVTMTSFDGPGSTS